ncbi:ras-like protein [Anaeramoeba flamelloides]|uniref:Ras-like protein n=1 Tax=Anaeramoeba flamelloides TaxID=1746091 RepID=A0AAV7YZ41_9EUKA|nr:ras-like protein [Anaeramoeba flamelloides]
MTETEERHKIVIIGGGSVGKSCLTIQFLQGKFIQDYDPTIRENYEKLIEVDEKPCCLEIIDTAGQDEYGSVRDKCIRLGEGFMIVYSIISRASYTEARKLHKTITRTVNNRKVPTVTLANKCDLQKERLISQEEGEKMAQSANSVYLETSAKTGTNVEEAFYNIIRQVREWKIEEEKRKKILDEQKDEDSDESNNKKGKKGKKKKKKKKKKKGENRGNKTDKDGKKCIIF